MNGVYKPEMLGYITKHRKGDFVAQKQPNLVTGDVKLLNQIESDSRNIKRNLREGLKNTTINIQRKDISGKEHIKNLIRISQKQRLASVGYARKKDTMQMNVLINRKRLIQNYCKFIMKARKMSMNQ